MLNSLEPIAQEQMDSVLDSIGNIDCVAVVRPYGTEMDKATPVIVADEALIFVAWNQS